MPDLVQWVTDFGDQSVVLPVFLVVLLSLCLVRWKRGVLIWFTIIVGTLGIMLLLKLGLGACSWKFGTDIIDSPSGHTASATALYGSLLSILQPRGRPIPLLIGPCGIAVVFALSRVVLHDHTVAEVIIGGLVCIGAASLFYLLAGPAPERLRPKWLVSAILVTMALVHGHRLPAERHVHSFATIQLRAWLCPT